jgi:photosystem II stability/assembly factor-like uncharacterized protein
MKPLSFLQARPLLLLGLFLSLILGLRAEEAAEHWLLLDAVDTGKALVTVGERGSILVSSDQGASWTLATTTVKCTLTSVCFAADGRQGWAAGHDGTIIATRDGGQTWTLAYRSQDIESSFLDIAVIAPGRILAVGAFGLAMQSSDWGHNWDPVHIGNGDRHFNHVQATSKGRVVITGESGLVVESTDQGATWTQLPTPYEGSFFGSLELADGRLLIHGLRGHAFVSTSDKGWTEVPTPTPSLLACSLRLADSRLLLAGQARCWLVGSGTPLTFKAWTPSLTSGVSALLQTRNGDILAFGEAGITRLPKP